MKLLFLLMLIVFNSSVIAGTPAGNPIAIAGPDQTIYLSQASSVTLNGSASSSGSYEWTDVSTDYKSGATITSPSSAVTTVTGLKQGVWYFQLAVTSNGMTATDVVVIRVDYDLPPSNGTLIHTFQLDANASVINDRHDTGSYFPVTDLNYSQSGNDPNHFFLFRDRLNGLGIDNEDGKLYSTIQDGYAGTDGFPRSEISLADYDFLIDTSHTYVFEWKGYFPQNVNYLTSWYQILTMFQIHGGVQVPTVFGFDLEADGNLVLGDVYDDYSGTDYGKGTGLKTVTKNFSTLDNFYNNTHTIRVTVREGRGYPGQTAFIKVELDGIESYFRNTGQVGSSHWDDYVKFGGLYDWNSAMVSGNDLWRGRKFQLVTEAFNVYALSSNQSPKANAGSDQTLTLPNSTANLSGTGSDPDGTISSYQWTQVSGPSSTAVIKNPNSASTSVNGLTAGVYQFQLEVTDNQGAKARSTTTVTVKAAGNVPPSASAGTDQTITLPVNEAQLSGSGTDGDGTIVSYGWTKILGPAATITDTSSATTKVTGLVQGTYKFELTVKDDKGATAKDTILVTVKAAANINKAPTANAGSDKAITLPTDSIRLSGSGTDSDGTVVSYSWNKISGPSAFITDSSSAVTTAKNLLQGIYEFELTVADNKGAAGKDTVKVTVNQAATTTANKPPVANAGADQNITLPNNNAKLTGSGSDSDGQVVSFLWTKISGPAQGDLKNYSSASTPLKGIVQGTYQFELTVTDNKGATAKDTVKIFVNTSKSNTIINIPPVANAGFDQNITLPADSVQLSGNGTDEDGTVVSYEWTNISGLGSTIVDKSSAATKVTGLAPGTYRFELIVTDDKGATGKDTVNVTVKAAHATNSVNKAPVANAGADKSITLPTNSIQLSGSGSDSDGTVVSYSWTKISGPASNITDSSLATTKVTGLAQGTYRFELTVTDDKGATGKDTVRVTVNAEPATTSINKAPTADAGPDESITIPTNSIQLSGSGTDVDGTISSFGWTKISGPSTFALVNSSSPIGTVNSLVEGVYQFELVVTDDQGAIGKDTVKVTVNAAKIVNQKPVANAGADQVLNLPDDSTSLNGIGSDRDGTIASYGWTKISGPSSYVIRTPSLANTKISDLQEGVYQFQLKVSDDKGGSAMDTIQITVNAAVVTTNEPVNQPPVANAGTDVTTVSSASSVTLTGTGTDKDGSISNFLWKQLTGPSIADIAQENSATTSVGNLTGGTYEFELIVTDNKGAVGKDTVNVTVALERLAPKTGKLSVYPNPVHDIATVEVTAPQNNTNVGIVITDMSGTTVLKKEFVSNSSQVNQQIDMSGLVKGVYVVSVFFDGMEKQSVKVVRL